jgi:hypothetical protein
MFATLFWLRPGAAMQRRNVMFKGIFGLILVLALAGAAAADLVGYWPLDGNGMDASGKGNDGTVNGNVLPAEDRFENPSSAMSFAGGGGGDNIDVGDPAELQLTGAMTITAWVYLDSTSEVHPRRNARILAKMGGGGSRSWSTGVEMDIDGVPLPATIQVSSDGSDVVSLNDNASLPLDQWVHFAGVYDPGTSMQVYLDGDLNATITSSIPASQFSANGQPVLIGNRPACGNCGWYGSLDEVRIYDEALSQDEIKDVMDSIPDLTLLGDVNLDGEVNGLDVDPFVDVLLNGPYQAEADMNVDQVVNGLDVDPFVAAVVGGGGAQAVPEPSTLLLCLVALGVVALWWKRSLRTA